MGLSMRGGYDMHKNGASPSCVSTLHMPMQPPQLSPVNVKRRRTTCSRKGSSAQPREPDWDAAKHLRVAITLRGAEISEAILRGYKDIENRSIRLPIGWVALHTGKGQVDPSMQQTMRKLVPGLPPSNQCPIGA